MTAIAFAFASPVWAIDINSWEELSNSVLEGETDFVLQQNVMVSTPLDANSPLSIDGQGHSLTPDALLTPDGDSALVFNDSLTLKKVCQILRIELFWSPGVRPMKSLSQSKSAMSYLAITHPMRTARRLTTLREPMPTSRTCQLITN